MIHREYEEALKAARNGMNFAATDMLEVYEVLLLLLTDQSSSAFKKANVLMDQEVRGNEFYATYQEAFLGEIEYFRFDFGIDHPDFDRLIKAFE